MFTLHPRLEADTNLIKDLPISRALMMNDARYPWMILVPRQPDLKELHQLSEEDGLQLWREIKTMSSIMEDIFPCDKVNVGALGNLVPQLHIHIIARQVEDAAWPSPVWGVGSAETLTEEALFQRISLLKKSLDDAF